ncbi:hypothetical protein F5890DRAFT_1510462 [Lentinula detonsa]|uniref:Uncharacterized protein n=1 Tax=Lentinula detonsa TaxID=2804962 RepID=A0AA38Q0W7_9AGAR|nr:hypothetical protein F5890DRAFT_1510462 [Lentinula detonsa]
MPPFRLRSCVQSSVLSTPAHPVNIPYRDHTCLRFHDPCRIINLPSFLCNAIPERLIDNQPSVRFTAFSISAKISQDFIRTVYRLKATLNLWSLVSLYESVVLEESLVYTEESTQDGTRWGTYIQYVWKSDIHNLMQRRRRMSSHHRTQPLSITFACQFHSRVE